MSSVKTKMNEDLLRGFQRKDTKKVVLLYSGGIDSTAVGLILKEQGYDVFPLFIDYGQSSCRAEEYLVNSVCEKAGFNITKTISTDLLSQLSKSKLLGENSLDDQDAWVPGRNTIFMVIAGIYAKQIDADGISLGYMLDDNFVFGDNDYFHHKNIEELLSKSFLQPMKVFLPALAMNKKDMIKKLIEYHLVDDTVSCWNASLEGKKIISCHKCANCVERDNYLAELEPAI